jgi:adenylate kinase
MCDACSITQSVSADNVAEREGCPYCGGNLVVRADDNPDTVRRRLSTYAEQAAPLIDFYRPRRYFSSIDGLRHADRVTTAILAWVNECAGVAGTQGGWHPRGQPPV